MADDRMEYACVFMRVSVRQLRSEVCQVYLCARMVVKKPFTVHTCDTLTVTLQMSLFILSEF